MNKVIFLFSMFFSLGCFSAEEYSQTRCDLSENGVLIIQFARGEVSRRISLAPSRNIMTFRGSTLSDMKWTKKLDAVEYFTYDDSSVLLALFKDGRKFSFGKIDSPCKKTVENILGDLFESSESTANK